ncbi:MAG: site-specific integrase [Gemmataceae bacterium]
MLVESPLAFRPKATDERSDGEEKARGRRRRRAEGRPVEPEVRAESFHLDATPPVVVVEAKDQKGKRDEPVPIPAHLVAPLRAWLATQPAGQPLWPGTWAKNREQWSWMRRDVKRAGIAVLDARGRNVTFHGLRRRYVTRLFQAGGTVPEVRRLARHKDVRTTLTHYTDETMGELAALADKLGAV